MSQLGIRTEPSLDPGADPRRDGVAAIVDAALATKKACSNPFRMMGELADVIDRLLSERHRAEEAMRERAAALCDASELEFTARRIRALPLTPEPTHER